MTDPSPPPGEISRGSTLNPLDDQGAPIVKTYILTMRIEANDDINAEQIREEIYDACPDVPFGFDITSIIAQD